MSLISTQNFAAPFRSKVQVGALLVLAALVGMIRFASHSEQGVGAGSIPSTPSVGSTAEDDVTRFLEERSRARRQAPAAQDNSIEDLFDGEAPADRRRDAPEIPARPPGEPEKLNDIKRLMKIE